MRNDPFFREIIKRLDWDLDPVLFEACVNDLLRDAYPSLVPIPGGRDAGMDGAIADGEGEAYPLVVTTQKDVIGNLTKSLESYLSEGKNRKKIVLATSQSLSPIKRRNLEKRSRELGFVLVNVHEREDIANRLYRRPNWCLELLQLPGRPSAFSEIPKSIRPILNSELIGRSSDIEWLRYTGGDRLLVGQPGSGKTYLLLQYVQEGYGYFVVDDDRGNLAESIRSYQPRVLIVDDAGTQLSILAELIHLRKELGAAFNILASCWYVDEEKVQTTLNLGSDTIYHLDLLPRNDIVEVIKNVRVYGPDELIKEIVDQAEGRPGLAAMLAHLCLIGDVKRVFKGEALTASILGYLEPYLGRYPAHILAAIALGGNKGMSLEAVANGLGIPLIEVQGFATKLAVGGVLWEVEKRYISLHPRALRHVLIRDIFFPEAFSIPISPLIDRSPDLAETVIEIIGAYWAEARIDFVWLVEFLERVNSKEAWELFAWQGQKEAKWVMDHHPDLIALFASPFLAIIPEATIPLLFEASIGDDRPLHSATDHPMRIIDDWIKSGWPEDEQTIKNRHILINEACDWLGKQGNIKVGFQALKSGFSPLCMRIRTDPGLGDKFTISSTCLTLIEMKNLQAEWGKLIDFLRDHNKIDWPLFREIIAEWAVPGRLGFNVPEKIRQFMHSFAHQMLFDMGVLAQGRSGLLHWINQFALNSGFDLRYDIDSEFEILYPIGRRKVWRDHENEQRERVLNLARKWSKEDPIIIVEKILWFENEARIAGQNWPRWTIYLFAEIANQVDSPMFWIEKLISSNSAPEMIFPFLSRVAEELESGWVDLLQTCLSTQDLRESAIHIILSHPQSPLELTEEALELISGYSGMVEGLCIRQEIENNEILKRLLNHPDDKISSAAAQGIWFSPPRDTIPEPLISEWRGAVIRCREEFFITEVIKSYPDLAFDWLSSFIKEDPIDYYGYKRVIPIVVNALDERSRREILHLIPANYRFYEVVYPLVGDNLDLYQALLSDKRLRDFHLVPIVWSDHDIWIEKAKAALSVGYSPDKIASAAYGFMFWGVSWVGDASLEHQKWVERFEKLCSYPDEGIRAIGRAGKARAEQELERALRNEKHDKIYGIRM